MSDAIIGSVLTQLGSILEKQIRQELRLVVGVDKDVENLQSTFKAIKAVLLDAEMSRVRKEKEKEGLQLWLQNLQEVSYDMDDILADWINAIIKRQQELENASPKKKVCISITFPCFCFGRVVLRRDIALNIKDINERLDRIALEKDRYHLKQITIPETSKPPKSVSFINMKDVCGRDGDTRALVEQLLNQNSQSDDRGFQLISIVGMGGVGKTTLAQLAYNSEKVKNRFKKRIWVCVSDSFDASRIGKAIIEDAEGNAPNLFELNSIMKRMRQSIGENQFLLVLDDVWNEDPVKWEPLRTSLNNDIPGSKILVTTRNEGVATMMRSSHKLRLDSLSEPDCWSLFKKIAFYKIEKSKEEREELENIGKKIANKCKGLPLAAITVGNLMCLKNSVKDWQSVLDSNMWELGEAKEGPFAPLLLSYYDLPSESTMRRCFSYCAIFPKDYKIEADNLIKIWMAQGYVSSEELGQSYLDNLIGRCFFQDLEKDKDGESIVRFKMHDMVHDFAQYLTKDECQMMEIDKNLGHRINLSSSNVHARHLTLIRSEDVPFPVSVRNMGNPHTFWVQSFYDCPALVSEEDKVSSELLSHLSYVKALDLSRNRLRELPEEIGKLMNVRYLNLSHNPLSELPEVICGLYNLQTLKLVACDHLRTLPQGIGRLISLRHLEIDRTDHLEALPKGIGKLKSIQTLNKFILAASGDPEMCKLGDLKDLNLLRGCLKIEGLGSVSNVAEAKKAELKSKTNLTGLHMDFRPMSPVEGRSEVAEALELQTGLQSLQISFYRGTRLPMWITSLNKLQKLQLQDCQNCTQLPPLGRLPSLQTLYIENMHWLKRIGSEFLGTDVAVAASSTDPVIIFPKLKKLKFEHMNSWEEWELISMNRGAEEGNMKIMPYLRYLKLSGCKELKALPDSLLQKEPLIRKLRISKSPHLQQKYQKGSGEHWKISPIQKVRISPNGDGCSV